MRIKSATPYPNDKFREIKNKHKLFDYKDLEDCRAKPVIRTSGNY